MRMKIKFYNKLIIISIIIASSLIAESKIVASDGQTDDRFGKNVVTTDNWVIVSANRDDDNGLNSGSVYAYYIDNDNFEEYKIQPLDGTSDDYFGKSISIDNNWLAVGSVYDDENGIKSGSCYVFYFNGLNWIQHSKIIPSDGSPYDRFGYTVDIKNDILIVSAVYDDDFGNDSGSVYIYRKINNVWEFEQKIFSPDIEEEDLFGLSLSIHDDIILASSVYDDDFGDNSGSVNSFVYTNSGWVHSQKILPSDGNEFDLFGNSIDQSDNILAIGSFYSDSDFNNSGSVYIYTKNDNFFEFSLKIQAYDASLNDKFGQMVTVYENWVAVGSLNNDNGINSGSIYIYNILNEEINASQKITASDGNEYDEYSISASLNNHKLVVGAHFDDDLGDDSGSIYLYTYRGCPYEYSCNYDLESLFFDNLVCIFEENGYDCNANCDFPIDECGACNGLGPNGDVNYDQNIDIVDILLILEMLLGESLFNINSCTSDINMDNLVNITDIIIIIENILEN